MASKKKTILLVDDEKNVLLTWRLVFEHKGFAVTTAENCTEAMTILAADERHFDVVVTDLNMEQDDIGLKVARSALKRQPKPVVVVCTGYATVENSKAALNMGVDYMAHKPVDWDDFISALDRLMMGQRAG
jgi:DNA-binding NtrC family response regulator